MAFCLYCFYQPRHSSLDFTLHSLVMKDNIGVQAELLLKGDK